LAVEIQIDELLGLEPSVFSGYKIGKVHDILHLVLNLLHFHRSRWNFVAFRHLFIFQYFVQLGEVLTILIVQVGLN